MHKIVLRQSNKHEVVMVYYSLTDAHGTKLVLIQPI